MLPSAQFFTVAVLCCEMSTAIFSYVAKFGAPHDILKVVSVLYFCMHLIAMTIFLAVSDDQPNLLLFISIISRQFVNIVSRIERFDWHFILAAITCLFSTWEGG